MSPFFELRLWPEPKLAQTAKPSYGFAWKNRWQKLTPLLNWQSRHEMDWNLIRKSSAYRESCSNWKNDGNVGNEHNLY